MLALFLASQLALAQAPDAQGQVHANAPEIPGAATAPLKPPPSEIVEDVPVNPPPPEGAVAPAPPEEGGETPPPKRTEGEEAQEQAAPPADADAADGPPAEATAASPADAADKPAEPAMMTFISLDPLPEDTVITVLLQDTDGTVTEIPLNDDGLVPDRTAGDGTWVGASWFAGDTATCRIKVNDTEYPELEVPFREGGRAPVAQFQLANGAIRLQLKEATVRVDERGNMPPGEEVISGKERSGRDGEPGRGAKSGKGSKSGKGGGKGGQRKERQTRELVLYGLVGLSALATLAIGVLWGLSRWSGGRDPMRGLVPEPEPGLVHPDLPSLSQGLARWTVPPDQLDALVGPLLQTLARHRRVLVVAPAEQALPAVWGHGVYRVAATDPDDVLDTIFDLLRAMPSPIALLVLAPPDGLVADLEGELPAGTGGVVLQASQDAAGDGQVRATRHEAGWQLARGAVQVVAHESSRGLSDRPT